jgi:hypothetical protein
LVKEVVGMVNGSGYLRAKSNPIPMEPLLWPTVTLSEFETEAKLRTKKKIKKKCENRIFLLDIRLVLGKILILIDKQPNTMVYFYSTKWYRGGDKMAVGVNNLQQIKLDLESCVGKRVNCGQIADARRLLKPKVSSRTHIPRSLW